MKSIFLNLLVVFTMFGLNAQNYSTEDIAISEFVDGTLLKPNGIERPHLAIIIADYGPVDRNGNQNFTHNDALKKLAVGLSNNGIATFRYDKRSAKMIRNRKSTSKILFNDFVVDASAVIEHFANTKNFQSIAIIGQGQGSLVGMLATNAAVDRFISIGASAKSIDQVIVDQVTMMDASLGEKAKDIAADLKKGTKVTNIPPALGSVFNAEIQAFMSSWMQFDPIESTKSLNIPLLIINGTKDLQVSVEEAKSLAEANETSKLVLIKDMNHVFFEIQGNDLENSKSYNESFRSISKELISVITAFIND